MLCENDLVDINKYEFQFLLGEGLRAWKLHLIVSRIRTRDDSLQYVADMQESLSFKFKASKSIVETQCKYTTWFHWKWKPCRMMRVSIVEDDEAIGKTKLISSNFCLPQLMSFIQSDLQDLFT